MVYSCGEAKKEGKQVAVYSIIAMGVERIAQTEGRRGRRTKEDEVLRMDTPGGSVYLRKSAVEAAGGSWRALKGRYAGFAAEKGIPFADHTI
jgi:hypothetical protein